MFALSPMPCRDLAMTRILDYVRQQAETHRAMAANETDVKAKADLFILAARWDAVGDRHEQFLRQLVVPSGQDVGS